MESEPERDVLIDVAVAATDAGRHRLVEQAVDRLKLLSRGALFRHQRLRRWEGSDDIAQAAAARLLRALQEARPADERQFWALCAEMIRRELLDLHRKHYGPTRHGRHHASPPADVPRPEPIDFGPDLSSSSMGELHEAVARLPDELKSVVDLHIYAGLTRAETADLLAVSERTVTRRWREARERLFDLLSDAPS